MQELSTKDEGYKACSTSVGALMSSRSEGVLELLKHRLRVGGCREYPDTGRNLDI